MIRRAGAVIATLVALLSVCACDDDRAPWAPSLQPAFGARVTDGQLHIWTGSRCFGVSRLAFAFEPNGAELVLTSRDKGGVELERLVLGGPYPGLEVSKPLPEGFDWRNEESVSISIYGGSQGWGSSSNLAEVVKGSAEHPDDTYWFQGVGWLDPADVAAQDTKTFLATCTHDPAKQ
jgi:hypothetical protein